MALMNFHKCACLKRNTLGSPFFEMSKFNTVIWPKVILFGDSITQVRFEVQCIANFYVLLSYDISLAAVSMLRTKTIDLSPCPSVFISSEWLGSRNR